MKKNLLTFFILFIFFLMLALPSITKEAANEGLNLWIFTVLPALLPYTIISSILMELNAFSAPCRLVGRLIKRKLPEHEIFIVICGCLCGCPIGAKVAADSYKSGKIKKRTAEFLMCAFNNISPSFLLNYIFVEIYSPFIDLSSTDKWMLYLIIIASSITGASIVSYEYYKLQRKQNISKHFSQTNTYMHINQSHPNNIFPLTTATNKNSIKNKFTFSKSTFISIFDKCILSSFEIQVKIGGYIILFNIINKIFLCTLDLSLLQSSIFGSVMELTSGLGLFLSFSNPPAELPYWLMPAVISSITTFGGLCTIFQTKAVLTDTDLSIRRYALSKVAAGITAFVLTFIFYYV